MKLHIIMHEIFESPGAIEKWAQDRKYPINYTRLYDHEKLPENCDNFDLLIIMGGPQSPKTTTAECPHFDTVAEQAFIKRAIAEGKAVLGVCLGAQLIGEALGASVAHSPNKEIGVFDIILTEAAKNDPIFSQFPPSFGVAHWHGDMPGLTKEAELLAYSQGCPRQIIRYTPKVYGFQCHFEFTQSTIEAMIENCGHEIKAEGKYIQTEAMLRNYDYEEMNQRLFFFLDQWCSLCMA